MSKPPLSIDCMKIRELRKKNFKLQRDLHSAKSIRKSKKKIRD